MALYVYQRPEAQIEENQLLMLEMVDIFCKAN